MEYVRLPFPKTLVLVLLVETDERIELTIGSDYF